MPPCSLRFAPFDDSITFVLASAYSQRRAHAHRRSNPPAGIAQARRQLAALGHVPGRTPVGNGPRRLLARRRLLELLPARTRPQPRLPLGRRWPIGLLRPRVPTLLRARALEWPRPVPQRASLRPRRPRR